MAREVPKPPHSCGNHESKSKRSMETSRRSSPCSRLNILEKNRLDSLPRSRLGDASGSAMRSPDLAGAGRTDGRAMKKSRGTKPIHQSQVNPGQQLMPNRTNRMKPISRWIEANSSGYPTAPSGRESEECKSGRLGA